jgi:3,4-dihydroxyphenylacetate 2,3-dioxygenase
VLVDALKAKGMLAGQNTTEHYKWDYGTFVPLQYLDPAQRIPVVTMGTCVAADLDECFQVGVAVRDAARKSGKRVVFVASTALSHKLVRAPEAWPTEMHQKLDHDYLDLLRDGKVAEARRFLDDYAPVTHVEMGGRTLATMLGVLDGIPAAHLKGAEYGEYGPSSGAGHTNFAVAIQ